MSKPSCDACSNLRENNANFIMNGVTDTVAASLANNTGFNPCLTSLHNDCEDLNDANDCLIGHLDDDVDNYDVCKWKDFMHNFLPNLYEMLKAIIAAICGLWTKSDDLEKKIEQIKEAACAGATASIVPLTRVDGTTLSTKAGANSKWYIACGLNKITACDGSQTGVGAVALGLRSNDDVATSAFDYIEKLATFKKTQLVPNYMTEEEYEFIYAHGFQFSSISQGSGNSKSLFLTTLYGSTINLSDASDNNPNDHSELTMYAWGYVGGVPDGLNLYGYRSEAKTYVIGSHH